MCIGIQQRPALRKTKFVTFGFHFTVTKCAGKIAAKIGEKAFNQNWPRTEDEVRTSGQGYESSSF